ncbi:hypothetical protein O9929_21260 [Vibrio lentus]|nr:hypothetical protein [Vibrio lentus]
MTVTGSSLLELLILSAAGFSYQTTSRARDGLKALGVADFLAEFQLSLRAIL